MTLAPLRCAECGAPAALAVADATPCAHCEAQVPIPADYRAAAELQAETATARSAAEPLWRRLSGGVSPAVEWSSAGALVLLPPIVTGVSAALAPLQPLGTLFALATLPATLPGAGVWIWCSAVAATTLPYREALAASPPAREGDAPNCRSCGAPLAPEPEALAATCLYCGTDSVLELIPLGALGQRLKDTLRTIRDANVALRRRRILLALSIAGVLTFVLGFAVVILFAVAALS